MKIIKGSYEGKGFKIGIVVSQFNRTVTELLKESAIETLLACNVEEKDITIVHVPGAFEIPLIAQQLAASSHFHAIICLGAVIRGETPHFDYVCSNAASGVATLNLKYEIPIILGIITTNTVEEAWQRSGVKGSNKGAEAALCAIEMAQVQKKLKL